MQTVMQTVDIWKNLALTVVVNRVKNFVIQLNIKFDHFNNRIVNHYTLYSKGQSVH